MLDPPPNPNFKDRPDYSTIGTILKHEVEQSALDIAKDINSRLTDVLSIERIDSPYATPEESFESIQRKLDAELAKNDRRYQQLAHTKEEAKHKRLHDSVTLVKARYKFKIGSISGEVSRNINRAFRSELSSYMGMVGLKKARRAQAYPKSPEKIARIRIGLMSSVFIAEATADPSQIIEQPQVPEQPEIEFDMCTHKDFRGYNMKRLQVVSTSVKPMRRSTTIHTIKRKIPRFIDRVI